jgi:colanic acid/amylovoran biosynthesis protein
MSRPHHVEVAGVNFVNKGAELMLEAVLEALSKASGGFAPVVALRHGGFGRRTALGLGHLARLGAPKLSRVEGLVSHVANLIPAAALRPGGVVRERDVATVLDASGFLYSDQWSSYIGRANVRHYRRWKRGERTLVLLPQAFGPFEKGPSRALMEELLELADLVYARDGESLAHLRGLRGAGEHVRRAPDFTNLLEPRRGPRTPRLDDHVVFIPNGRMVDKGAVGDEDSYVRDFAALIDRAADAGHVAVVVVHEANDRALARRIAAQARSAPTVVDLEAPREIKAVLADARLVVSSRFHGLVSALSQGVPSVAVGWSHKYRELLEDYGSADCLGASTAPDGDVLEIVLRELEEGQQAPRRSLLAERAVQQKEAAERMWSEVFHVIRGGAGP